MRALVALTVLVSLTGCTADTGSGRSGSDAPGIKLPPSAAPGPAGASQRTSIATASAQGISASLRANGVDDPAHWAQIIMQYRPYPANDPTQRKLTQVLHQFKADPTTIGKITGLAVVSSAETTVSTIFGVAVAG